MTPETATYNQMGNVYLARARCLLRSPVMPLTKVNNTNGITPMESKMCVMSTKK